MQIIVLNDVQQNIDNIEKILNFSKKDNYGFNNIQRRIKSDLNKIFGDKEMNYLNNLQLIRRELNSRDNLEKMLSDKAKDLEFYVDDSKLADKFIEKLEEIYKEPVPKWKVKVYLNIVSISSYSFRDKWTMVYYNNPLPQQSSTILHELNHFMFHYYYYHLMRELSYSRFHEIKESLTILTNPAEKGYPNHIKTREYIGKHYKEGVSLQEIIESLSQKK